MTTTDRDPIHTEVSAWLAANWYPTLTLREWWARLAASGLAFPTWPAGSYGRGWGRSELRSCSRAFAEAGAIGGPTGLGTLMGGPIVNQFGTDEQRTRLLPPLAAGSEAWCQLFSEPGAGSDLASVATKAVRDGDEWIVSGQKVWTSGASHAARGMLVARTNPEVPKHRGITYFIIDLRQPGVEVRPLKQMNGRSHFSEVFFDEARVSDADRISGIDAGWAVTVATLSWERSGLSSVEGVQGVQPIAGEMGGQLDRTLAELIDEARSRRTENDAAGGMYAHLRHVAAEVGRLGDPDIRARLAHLYSLERIAGFTQLRSAAAAAGGRSPGPEASVAKLFWTEGLRHSRDLGMAILGAQGLLASPDSPGGGLIQHFVLSMPSASIAGGSDEVQRNIIGERALGLPKDISVDTDVAFRDVRRS